MPFSPSPPLVDAYTVTLRNVSHPAALPAPLSTDHVRTMVLLHHPLHHHRCWMQSAPPQDSFQLPNSIASTSIASSTHPFIQWAPTLLKTKVTCANLQNHLQGQRQCQHQRLLEAIPSSLGMKETNPYVRKMKLRRHGRRKVLLLRYCVRYKYGLSSSQSLGMR